LVRVWSASIIGLFVPEQRLGAFGSLRVCHGGCPVDCGLPLVLVLIAESGCCGSFVLDGTVLVGEGCPAEGAGAGSNRPFCGSLRGGQMAFRRG
jgi:hypothetical protein